MSQFRSFGFRETYGAADGLRHLLVEEDEDDFLVAFDDSVTADADNADFKQRALAPQQTTFLHLLIESYLRLSSEYLRYKADTEIVLREFDSSFAAHGVDVPPEVRRAVDRMNRLAEGDEADVEDDKVDLDVQQGAKGKDDNEEDEDEEDEDEEDDAAEAVDMAYKLYQEACIPKITTEIFTLLFADRRFLLALNERLANLISSLKVADEPDLLERDGVVKRCTYWPAWLRRALIFRDKGHCAICLRDISGVVAISEEGYHVDHIVPLDLGGTNDPTNLQLLCEACNLKKGAGEANTSSFGMVYW